MLRQSDWSINQREASLVMEGWLEISNPHARMEVMVPELEVHPTLIGSADLRDIVTSTRITPQHPRRGHTGRWLLARIHREGSQEHQGPRGNHADW